MTSVRKEIERNVRAYHNTIPDFVKDRLLSKEQLQSLWDKKISEMPIIELLRYVHPNDRSELANKALKEELITKGEAAEFIKFLKV
jgi:hypothetical protein